MEINQQLQPITAVSLKQVEVTVMEVIAVTVMLRSLVKKKWRRASVRLITNTIFLVSWLKSRRVPVVSEA